MKAIETTATIDALGHLTLDMPLITAQSSRVRVIVLIPEEGDIDSDDTPDDIIIEGIHQGIHQALSGQTIPLSQMWEDVDVG